MIVTRGAEIVNDAQYLIASLHCAQMIPDQSSKQNYLCSLCNLASPRTGGCAQLTPLRNKVFRCCQSEGEYLVGECSETTRYSQVLPSLLSTSALRDS